MSSQTIKMEQFTIKIISNLLVIGKLPTLKESFLQLHKSLTTIFPPSCHRLALTVYKYKSDVIFFCVNHFIAFIHYKCCVCVCVHACCMCVHIICVHALCVQHACICNDKKLGW